MRYALEQLMKIKLEQLILGLVISLLGVILYWLPIGQELEENFGLYGLFQFRGGISAPQDTVVIAIDQPSATELGLSIKPSLWPRRIHAELIRILSNAGARVIVFDLIFDKPSLVPEDDIQLLEAMEASRNVIVVERLVLENTNNLVDSTRPALVEIVKESSARLLPIFSEAALGNAPFPLPRASHVNSYWTFKTSAGDIPTIPTLVLQAYTQPIYDDFVHLLKLVNARYLSELPANTEAADLGDLILTLRKIFMSSLHVKQEMLQAVDQDIKLSGDKKRQLRALINLYAGDDSRFLNLYGPPRTVKTVPYHQVLKSADEEWVVRQFKDKAVFIGFSAATQPEQDKVRDDYHTVFSNTDGLYISGVELAATAFANLLEDRSIKPLSSIKSVFILFLLGFTISVALLDLRLSIWQAVVLGLIPIAIYLGYVYTQFDTVGIWMPWIIPIIQTFCALLGALLLRYLTAKRERQQLEAAFGYFLPERVVDDITKNAGVVNTSSQLVYGLCLATDAEMYTALAEKMDPRSLGRLMNDYYAVLFEPVKKHQGIVSDVVGDAMLALWTAPTAEVTLHKQACLAGLDMVRAVAEFNRTSDRPQLQTRIGLHFGEMLLGHVGAIHHYEYRAVGDMVNTANRIQGANKYLGTRLLVSSEVVTGLDEFLIRPLGRFILAGKSESVGLAELITDKHEASPEQLALCEAFSSALHAYQSQQWTTACDLLSQILKTYPGDGPTIFLLEHCQSLIGTPPVDAWDPTIRMKRK